MGLLTHMLDALNKRFRYEDKVSLAEMVRAILFDSKNTPFGFEATEKVQSLQDDVLNLLFDLQLDRNYHPSHNSRLMSTDDLRQGLGGWLHGRAGQDPSALTDDQVGQMLSLRDEPGFSRLARG